MSEDAQDVVLVVEDEPAIRMILRDYLAGEGYHVLVAEDGEQAFAILASKPHLDLMVTDFRLPGGISGVEIAEPAVKLRPDLKVIFISGYPAEIIESGSRSRARRRSWPSRSTWRPCTSRSRPCCADAAGSIAGKPDPAGSAPSSDHVTGESRMRRKSLRPLSWGNTS